MVILRSYYLVFKMALRGLQRHMMRSVLSGLGIVIGVAAVIAMMEIGQGSSYMIRKTIESLGANVLRIVPSSAVKSGASTGSGGKVTLTPDDAAAILHEWCGLRPCTPDGLPVVGPVPGTSGLLLATGHAKLGLTLGPATGLLIAQLVEDEAPAIDLHPLRVDRF